MIVLKKDNELNLNNTIKNLDNKETDLKTKIRYDNNNEKIKEKYNDNIDHGNFKKELKILNQNNKVKSTVNIDKS